MKIRHSYGYTLIETTVTVAIMAILAAVAWSAFESQSLKSHRADAVSALTAAAVRQEKWRSKTGNYTTDINDLGGSASPNNYYSLAVDSADDDTFSITATAQGKQLNDTDCRTMTIDHADRRTSKNAGGSSTNNCWPR